MTKFHINKNGVPSPCKASKGKCPLGGVDGTENHFDNFEEAEKTATLQNEKENGFIPNIPESGTYNGDEYSSSAKQNERLRRSFEAEEIGEVLSDVTKDTNITFDLKTESFNNTPVEFSAEVENIGDGRFKVHVEKASYFSSEEDFDTKEDYEDYLSDGPDNEVEYSFEFTEDELKYQISDNFITEERAPGAIYSSIYGVDLERGE